MCDRNNRAKRPIIIPTIFVRNPHDNTILKIQGNCRSTISNTSKSLTDEPRSPPPTSSENIINNSVANTANSDRSWEEEPLESFLEMERLCSDEYYENGDYTHFFNGISTTKSFDAFAASDIGDSLLPDKTNEMISYSSLESSASFSNRQLGELIEVSEPSDGDDEHEDSEDDDNNNRNFNNTMETVDFIISKGKPYGIKPLCLPVVSENRVKILKNLGKFEVSRDVSDT